MLQNGEAIDVITTSEIKSYNEKNGENLVGGQSQVGLLKSIGNKVKNGGNLVYAFCYTGKGEGGIEAINELSKLQGNRLNTFLPIGYSATTYYKYNTGRGIKINSSLSGNKPEGWLQKNGENKPVKKWDVVMSSSNSALKTDAQKPTK